MPWMKVSGDTGGATQSYLVNNFAPSGGGCGDSNSTRGFRMGTRKKEWGENFGFLVRGDFSLEPAYRMLLMTATSRKDIERLHGLLPDNARLPHRELALLGEHWQRWYQPGRTGTGNSRVNDTLVQEYLSEVVPGIGLAQWYVEKLDEGREGAVWSSPLFKWQRKGAVFNAGGKTTGFAIIMLDRRFGAEFVIINKDWICVRLSLPGSELTEPLLYALQQLRPVSKKEAYFKGMGVRLYYEFSIEETAPFLRLKAEEPLLGFLFSVVAGETFCAHMMTRLLDLGLPIQGVTDWGC